MKKAIWKRYKIVNRKRFIGFLTLCLLIVSFTISSAINVCRALANWGEDADEKLAICEQQVLNTSYCESLDGAQIKIEESRKEQENTAVVVQYGDTLWELAKEYGNPNKDVREVIYDIRKLNNINPESLVPGTVLLIPKK